MNILSDDISPVSREGPPPFPRKAKKRGRQEPSDDLSSLTDQVRHIAGMKPEEFQKAANSWFGREMTIGTPGKSASDLPHIIERLASKLQESSIESATPGKMTASKLERKALFGHLSKIDKNLPHIDWSLMDSQEYSKTVYEIQSLLTSLKEPLSVKQIEEETDLKKLLAYLSLADEQNMNYQTDMCVERIQELARTNIESLDHHVTAAQLEQAWSELADLNQALQPYYVQGKLESLQKTIERIGTDVFQKLIHARVNASAGKGDESGSDIEQEQDKAELMAKYCQVLIQTMQKIEQHKLPIEQSSLGKYLREIVKAIAKDKPEMTQAALQLYQTIIQQNEEGLELLADIYKKLSQSAKECECYERMLTLNPKNVEVICKFATRLSDGGPDSAPNALAAKNFLEKAMQVNPNEERIDTLYSSLLFRGAPGIEANPLEALNFLFCKRFGVEKGTPGAIEELLRLATQNPAFQISLTETSPKLGLGVMSLAPASYAPERLQVSYFNPWERKLERAELSLKEPDFLQRLFAIKDKMDSSASEFLAFERQLGVIEGAPQEPVQLSPETPLRIYRDEYGWYRVFFRHPLIGTSQDLQAFGHIELETKVTPLQKTLRFFDKVFSGERIKELPSKDEAEQFFMYVKSIANNGIDVRVALEKYRDRLLQYSRESPGNVEIYPLLSSSYWYEGNQAKATEYEDTYYALTSLRSRMRNPSAIKQIVNDLLIEQCKLTQSDRLWSLIQAGANVEYRDSEGKTALHYAAQNQNLDGIKLLLKAGADAQAIDNANNTPWSTAIRAGGLIKGGFEQLYLPIGQRIEALKKDPNILEKGLSDIDIRKLAYLVEVFIPSITQIGQEVIQKLKKEMYLLPHSLLYKSTPDEGQHTRELYLLLQGSGTIKGSGGFKKATEAIKLPLKLEEEMAMQLAKVITKKDVEEEDLVTVERELQIYNELKDLPYILPIHSVVRIPAIGNQPRRIAMFAAPAIGEFASVQLTDPQLFSIAAQITQMVAGMHARGYLHGDKKGSNALILRNPDGSLRAGVIDFGFTWRPLVDTNKNLVFKNGFYGTIFCTAPELFGNRDFQNQGGDLFKAEVFAVGDMLYRKYFNQNEKFIDQTPWCRLLSKYINNFDQPVPNHQKEEFYKILQDKVVAPYVALVALSKTQPLSTNEQFELAIYKMLLPDPTQRPTMQEAFQELSRIAGQSLV